MFTIALLQEMGEELGPPMLLNSSCKILGNFTNFVELIEEHKKSFNNTTKITSLKSHLNQKKKVHTL